MYGQAAGIRSFAKRLELLVHPWPKLPRTRLWIFFAAAPVLEFGTQGSDTAAVHIERAFASLGRPNFV